MNIILIGNGKTGSAIMRQLVADGHTVTVVDIQESALARSADEYDIMTVSGNGVTAEVLEQAGVRQADLLISFTNSDEVNLLSCLSARKLNPALHTIPRVREPEYLRLATDLREEFGISMVVNPDGDAAREMYMLLQFPEFLKRETFAKGRVEIVQLKVREDSKFNGASINSLSALTGCKVLVCAVVRDGKAFIPKGGGMLKAGDSVYVTAPAKVLSVLIRNLGISKKKIRHVMIIGGDRTCVHLARSLADSGVKLKIIENDYERSVRLAEQIPDATVINGDGAMQDVLDREGCGSMDALVTLTGLDEVNMIVSMYGTAQGVEKVITKINRIESPALLGGLNVGSVVSATQLSSRKIATYARALENKAGAATTIHSIADGQVEAMEFLLDSTAKNLGVPLKDVKLRKDVLLACIMRGSQTIIPDGSSVFHSGDSVVAVAPANAELYQFNDLFE